jgi:hypothetical protein
LLTRAFEQKPLSRQDWAPRLDVAPTAIGKRRAKLPFPGHTGAVGTNCGGERIIVYVNIAQASESTPPKPLRLCPGVALAALLLLFKFVIPGTESDEELTAISNSADLVVKH